MAALFSFLLITASLPQPATAFWRLSCISPIVAERADPIMSPGIPSSHVQTIMGGNAFSPTTTYTSTQLAICSSCTVRGDVSNACIPQLDYRYPNGSFRSVPQAAAATIYYLQRSRHSLKPNDIVQGFPAGLSMLPADPDKRNASASNDSPGLAISCVCLDCEGPTKAETGDFPSTSCLDGLRARVFFPACWDEETLNSGDHGAHLRRPAAGDTDAGCPGSRPVRILSFFYEVVLKLGGMWYAETQPFVWAQGDPTGFGLHADVLVGWDVDLLQRAVEMCTGDARRVEDFALFEMTSDALEGEYVVVSQVEERVVGVLGALPGCNFGPGEALSGLGRGNGAGNRFSVSGTKAVGGSSEVVSSGVADVSSSGSMAALSSDPGAPTVLSSSPNHAEILSSPTNSTHTKKLSASSATTTNSDHPLSAAPGTTTSITISVTKIHSVTIITSSTSVYSAVIGPIPSTALTRSKHTHVRRHAGLQGQQLYGDDLRLRKH